VDDKNIPDWVKRQAENPFKFIIQQERAKPVRPAATRDDRDAASRASSASTQSSTGAAASRRTPAAASAQAASQTPVATNAAPTSINSANEANNSNNTENPVPTVEAASASDAATTAAAAPPAAAAGAALPTAAAANQPDPNELIPIEQAEPQITRDILQQGVRSGVVTVRFTVGTDGKVSEANVVSSTDRVFNRSTLNAVRQWKFAPVAEPQSATVEIAFKLEG
jgi:TonB family protein